MLRSVVWMRSGQPLLPRTKAPAELLHAETAGGAPFVGQPCMAICLSWKPESCTLSCQPAGRAARSKWGT